MIKTHHAALAARTASTTIGRRFKQYATETGWEAKISRLQKTFLVPSFLVFEHGQVQAACLFTHYALPRGQLGLIACA